jgi:hypothetical protein
LIYHANQNDFDKYLPEINRMIDSIRLKVWISSLLNANIPIVEREQIT